MSRRKVEQLRVEADSDQAVASRVLDLLTVADRYPRHLELERNGDSVNLAFDLDPGHVDLAILAARVRQIPGVRRVVALGASR